MRKSTRFPAAVHILTMLAANDGEYLSSDVIARSMNTNRVVVRRLIARLADAGFVTSQSGVFGGARLEVNPNEVSLLQVYHAVEDGSIFRMHTPHPECKVGHCVLEDLNKVMQDAESAFENSLSGQTLAEVTRRGMKAMKGYLNSEDV